MKNTSILSQLDESEKGGIITKDELQEIEAAYGSRERYEEAMRNYASFISGYERPRTTVPAGRRIRLSPGTTTASIGNFPKIKRINIVGKVITNANDAALLFSSFRDPRIEIFNIAYTSITGEILGHTAWTSGLPSIASATENPSSHYEGIKKIEKMKENLGARKVWIAHNHPSGNPKPSPQDVDVTKTYAFHFRDDFGGQIVLDHSTYSYISPFGDIYRHNLNKPVKKYISKRREGSDTIISPLQIAKMFKKVLSSKEDTAAYAILDSEHRVVSWVYSDTDDVAKIKNFMRISGGTKVVVITNSDLLHKKYYDISSRIENTDKDIFLDVIRTDRKNGSIVENIQKARGKWELHENTQIKYIARNFSIQRELGLELAPDKKNGNERGQKFQQLATDNIDEIKAASSVTGTYYPNESFILDGGNNRAKEVIMSDAIQRANEFFSENSSLDADGKLRVKGLQDFNRSINAGKPFFGSLLEFALTYGNLPTDAELAQMPRQGEKPPLSERSSNAKEYTMSNEEKTVRSSMEPSSISPEEAAFLGVLRQRKIITAALKDGSLCCLPRPDGYADTTPAVNLVNGTSYHGANLLYLKAYQKQHGYPTAEYATSQQIEKAKTENPKIGVKAGEKSVSICFSEFNKEAQQWENKSVELYNIAQTIKPEELKTWALGKQQEKAEKETDIVIFCKSTEPEKYLGQYFTAVSMGGMFYAERVQGVEFATKMQGALYQKMENGRSNPFMLSVITNAASRFCKEAIKEVRTEYKKREEPKQELKRGLKI